MKRGTTLVAGQVVGQLFLIAVIPLLTRIFSPAEMGVYQIALAIALILQPLATLKIEAHIPAAPNSATVRAYNRRAGLAVALTCMVGVGAAATLFAVDSNYSEHLLLASLLLGAFAWMALDTALLIRSGELLRLTIRHLLAGLFTALLQLVAAVTIGEIWSLAFALLLGRTLAIILTRSRANNDGVGAASITLRSARDTGAAVGGSMAINLSNQAPVLYLAGMFGATAAGHLGIADRVAATPINLVGRSLAQFVQSSLAPFVRERKFGLFGASSNSHS
ncbi:oligosaccharide flippase family protein [Nesterenkonia sp. AN1]|uniref:oligosaccharide flippase family protein n=1 Tax=Nesterenkonia sp. AN1 TaxID=652017 RepID=UPI0012689637